MQSYDCMDYYQSTFVNKKSKGYDIRFFINEFVLLNTNANGEDEYEFS